MDKCLARVNVLEQCTNNIYLNNYCEEHYNNKNIIKIDEFPLFKDISSLLNNLTINIPQEKYIIYNNKPLIINKWEEDKYKKEASKTLITNYKKKYVNMSEEDILKEISGPAYINPLLATNHCDPISLEDIWEDNDGQKRLLLEMNKEFLFSYKEENSIWCFNIQTLRQLLLEQKGEIRNPYTRKYIPNDIIEKVQIKIEILEENNLLDLIVNDYELNNNKIIIMFEDILHKLNNIGINNIASIDKNWFLDLDIHKLKGFYNDLYDIFRENIITNYNLQEIYDLDIALEDIFIYNNNEFVTFNKLMLQYVVLSTILKMYKDNITICHIIIRAFGFSSSQIRNLYIDICY